MNLTQFIYIVASHAAILKCNAKEDKLSISSLSGSAATHHLRRSDLIAGQEEEESMKQKAQRTLSVAGTGLFQTVSRVLEEECCCCCCCDNDNNAGDDTDVGDNDYSADDTDVGDNDFNADDTDTDEGTHSPSSFPTPVPTPVPTISLSPSYIYKKIYASDKSGGALFGGTCASKDDSIVLGATADSSNVGAVYLFNRDGTNEVKMTPGVDSVGTDAFGYSVSMDEKIVVGTGFDGKYMRVFSREAIYENTITCTECHIMGNYVATHGDKIVTNAQMETLTGHKAFIYDTDGIKLKELDSPFAVTEVGISEDLIVVVAQERKVYFYSNSAPDFPLVTEMDLAARDVAISGDRVVIGHWVNNMVWLYSKDGSLIKELDHDVALFFGNSVDITDDKIYVGAPMENSVWIYSAATGDFIEEIAPPDGEEGFFGFCVSASESFYVVGAQNAPDADDVVTGAAYSINLPL